VTRLVERDGWPVEGSDRVHRALYEAVFCQCLEPHKPDYWETFDQMLLAEYSDGGFEEREHKC